MYHAMPDFFPSVNIVIYGWMLTSVAVLINLGCGAVNLSQSARLMRHIKRSDFTRGLMEELTEELRARSECIVKGHNWHIETEPLHNEKDQRMTVLIAATCEDCGTRLDFEIEFGIDQLSASTWRAWAGLKPQRPPG